MKQLYYFKPAFNPTAGTLDFTGLPNFSLNNLYAVVNVTRSTVIYAPGAPSLGATSITGNVITLAANTSAHSATDVLNVYYEAAAGNMSNTPAELGGQLQLMQETLSQLLVETKLTNILLSEGLSRTITINSDELQQLRQDINNMQNTISTN